MGGGVTTVRHPDGFQGPTNGERARTYGQLLGIVTHPAFRLGFLDCARGRPLDHDAIVARIYAETPPGALTRMGWGAARGFFHIGAAAVELAQYRYEEGRQAYFELGLRAKAWGHPDFPPAAVRRYIEERARAHREEPAAARAPIVSVVATMRAGAPLLDRMRGAA